MNAEKLLDELILKVLLFQQATKREDYNAMQVYLDEISNLRKKILSCTI